jgi:hypothetical protein
MQLSVKRRYAILDDVRGEQAAHDNDDDNDGDYNAVDNFCDGNADNFYFRDNDDNDYRGALDDEDLQMTSLIKITGKPIRRLLFSF